MLLHRDPQPPTYEGEIDGTISDLVEIYFNDDPDNDVYDMYMHQEPEMQPYIDSMWRLCSGLGGRHTQKQW